METDDEQNTETEIVSSDRPPPLSSEREDPRFEAAREAGNGEAGREMLEHAAMGAELDGEEERSALDWLLGDPIAIPHWIPVDFETPDGMRKLQFVVRKSDPKKIDDIEQRHVAASTGGRVDQLAIDTEVVAMCCDALSDSTGREVELTSSEFRTVKLRNRETQKVEPVTLATPMEALNTRFRGQQGLLMGVARELRRLAGFDSNRVGQAQRRLVEASLG